MPPPPTPPRPLFKGQLWLKTQANSGTQSSVVIASSIKLKNWMQQKTL